MTPTVADVVDAFLGPSRMAADLGVSTAAIFQWRRVNRIPHSRLTQVAAAVRVRPEELAHLSGRPATPARIKRANWADLERRYRAGATLEAIGRVYCVSRERVRQILAKRGLRGTDGGAHAVSERKRERAAHKRDQRYIAKHGCTYAQFMAVKNLGRNESYYRTPQGAYKTQYHNASTRKIEWLFTFWSWWQVWEKSGKWAERGRGGYVMARIGDTGPYSQENVRIVSSSANIAEYYDRERAIHGRVRSGQERKAA